MGVMFKLQVHKAKITMVFLRGYSVAMVTYCAEQMTLNCLLMIGNLFDTIIEATN